MSEVMIILLRRYEISIAHHLTGLPANHKCSRPHGHNYEIELAVRKAGPLQNGMMIDAQHLDLAVKPVLNELDHHDLNTLSTPEFDPHGWLAQPTLENVSQWLWWRLAFLSQSGTAGRYQIERLRMYETGKLGIEICA